MNRLIILLALCGGGLTAGCTADDADDMQLGELAGSATFVCPDGPMVHVDYFESGVAGVDVGERDRLWLPQVRSGSGARYSDGENEIWESKGELRITLADGAAFEHCSRDGA